MVAAISTVCVTGGRYGIVGRVTRLDSRKQDYISFHPFVQIRHEASELFLFFFVSYYS